MSSLDCVLIDHWRQSLIQFIFVFSQNSLHDAWHILGDKHIYNFTTNFSQLMEHALYKPYIQLYFCIFVYANIYATKWENDRHFVNLLTNLSCSLLWDLQITKCSRKDKSHSLGNESLCLEWWAQAGVNSQVSQGHLGIKHMSRKPLSVRLSLRNSTPDWGRGPQNLWKGRKQIPNPKPTGLKREWSLYTHMYPKSCPLSKKH